MIPQNLCLKEAALNKEPIETSCDWFPNKAKSIPVKITQNARIK